MPNKKGNGICYKCDAPVRSGGASGFCRVHHNESMREYRRNNQTPLTPEQKEKAKARELLKYAVKTGKVKKLPCCECGASQVEAHHADYSKPLDVVWLCPKHHRYAHRKTTCAKCDLPRRSHSGYCLIHHAEQARHSRLRRKEEISNLRAELSRLRSKAA